MNKHSLKQLIINLWCSNPINNLKLKATNLININKKIQENHLKSQNSHINLQPSLNKFKNKNSLIYFTDLNKLENLIFLKIIKIRKFGKKIHLIFLTHKKKALFIGSLPILRYSAYYLNPIVLKLSWWKIVLLEFIVTKQSIDDKNVYMLILMIKIKN